MKIQCPHCQINLEATPEHLGQIVNCPKCNGQFEVQNPDMALSSTIPPSLTLTTETENNSTEQSKEDIENNSIEKSDKDDKEISAGCLISILVFIGITCVGVFLLFFSLAKGYSENLTRKKYDTPNQSSNNSVSKEATLNYWNSLINLVGQHAKESSNVTGDVNDPGKAFLQAARLSSQFADNISALPRNGVDTELATFGDDLINFHKTKAKYLVDFVNSPSKQECAKRHDRLFGYIKSQEPIIVNKMNSVKSNLSRKYNIKL